MNIERAAFEAWAIEHTNLDLSIGEHGRYRVFPSRDAWAAWEARASQASQHATLVRAEALREAAGICADMHPFDNGVDCGQYILAAIDQPKEIR